MDNIIGFDCSGISAIGVGDQEVLIQAYGSKHFKAMFSQSTDRVLLVRLNILNLFLRLCVA